MNVSFRIYAELLPAATRQSSGAEGLRPFYSATRFKSHRDLEYDGRGIWGRSSVCNIRSQQSLVATLQGQLCQLSPASPCQKPAPQHMPAQMAEA